MLQQPQETNISCQGIILRRKKSVVGEMTQVALLKFTGADPLLPCQDDTGRFFVEDAETNGAQFSSPKLPAAKKK